MKKITLLLILLANSIILMAQQKPTKDQKIAQQTVINIFEALSMRDSVSLKTYCTAPEDL